MYFVLFSPLLAYNLQKGVVEFGGRKQRKENYLTCKCAKENIKILFENINTKIGATRTNE